MQSHPIFIACKPRLLFEMRHTINHVELESRCRHHPPVNLPLKPKEKYDLLTISVLKFN
jgi:hypothetical protein